MKKLLCCMMAAIVFLLSPLSAFASTTESMMMYSAGTRSIPTNYHIPFNLVVYNKNTNSFSLSPNYELLDNQTSSTIMSQLSFYGNPDDFLVGFRTGFEPTIKGGFYSEHVLDFGEFDFRFGYITPSETGNFMGLSPFAIPNTCYAIYTGVYDYQIYDGSVNYNRWYYDNAFTITKPVSLSFNDYLDISTNRFQGNVSIAVPSLSSSDILNVTAYRNVIKSATQLTDNQFEDYSYENIRISCDTVTVYVLYDIDKTNFVPYLSTSSGEIISNSRRYFIENYFVGSSSKPTIVNIRSVDYLDDKNFSFKNIANGFRSLIATSATGVTNVVTNATQNADRIIQNTTQKVDEVKQGVTEVKNSVIETKNSILDLPNKIKDMLLGLIVPDSETMSEKYSDFSDLLEQKLGIIYQIPMMLFDFFDTIVNAATTPQTSLTLPAFQLPWIDGSTLTVWNSMEYKIIPDGLEVLSDLIKTVTSMTVVVLTFNSVKRAYERFLRS